MIINWLKCRVRERPLLHSHKPSTTKYSSSITLEQGRKRPLDSPKRMIKRREREGKRGRRRDIEREVEIREREREGGREGGRERDREVKGIER